MTNIIASITWNVSPEIFSIGPVHIRWYGLLFALGFVVGFQFMSKIFLKEGKSSKDLEALTIYMIVGTVIGARLGHCLFYAPGYYLMNPLEIFKVWEGGLASHGAAIGILLSLYIYIKSRPRYTYLWILDRIVIVIALAGAFIRIGNFFNSEIVGNVSSLPWAVIFTRLDDIPRHPAQLYESISYILIFIFLMYKYKSYKLNVPEGRIFGMFLILLFGARFLIEFVKRDQEAFEAGMLLNMGQLLSIPFIIIGIFLYIRSIKYSHKKATE